MAPVRKSKSINKGFDEKPKPKKQKVPDLLGPKWSEVELQDFYVAYRKYGKDWKKIASVLRSRSTATVEALYNINRAYLSMPEGTASVSGLIAMMIDHYNMMDGSGSEETEDIALMARKGLKHQKAKGRLDSKREVTLQRQSICSSDKSFRRNSFQLLSTSSSDRNQSISKMFYGIQPNIPVRKRTPRVDVNKNPKGRFMNGNKVLSYKALDTSSCKISEQVSAGEKHSRYFILKPKSGGLAVDEKSIDDSLGSCEDRTGNNSMDYEESGFPLNAYKKGKKRKKEVIISEASVFDDIRDKSKLTGKGPLLSEDFASEGTELGRSPLDDHKKRSKTQVQEDEWVACDALQTLAEMSLMPYLATEPVEDSRKSVIVRSPVEVNAQLDVTLRVESPCKSLALKTLADEEVNSGDSNADIFACFKQCKSSVRSSELSSRPDQHTGETKAGASTTQVQASSHAIKPARRKFKRKRDRHIPQTHKKNASSGLPSQCSSLFRGRVQCIKDNIENCLSFPEVRKWCAYEWFYSAIDYPWFMRREFVEYLNHVGLGDIPRLTRVEWGVIRSSLGKPRRFSARFLQEEREKLEQYRASVRTHYEYVRAGLVDGLPNDLARPLSVGQQVVAIHPVKRELHDGRILATCRNGCLVEFDRRDLRAELVLDIDCMPLNPVENMPESLRLHRMSLNHQHSKLPSNNKAFMLASDELMQIRGPLLRVPPLSPAIANDMKVKQTCKNSHAEVAGNGSLCNSGMAQSQDMAHVHPKKDDMGPVPCLTQGLVTKAFSQRCGSSEANPGGVNGTLHTSCNSMLSREAETTTNVVEIVQGSTQKAQKMVDVAVKAMSYIRKGEDAYLRTGEVLDSSIKAERVTNCHLMMSSRVQEGFTPQNLVASCSSNPPLAGFVATSDPQVPSELISSCVATLLMIQTCSERQYPPGEVAQILDSAVRSLHPCCSQNLSIYREIQMCMGRIKTQMLALVPS